MSSPTLDKMPKGLGTTFKEQNNINVRFWEKNLPFTSTAGRISLNVWGKNRILILQGATDGTGYDGTTVEQKIGDFVYEMEDWVNNTGEQNTGIYTDSLGNSYIVDAIDWQWSRSNVDPNRILFTLMMKET
jgi:hypothetical protein